MGQLSRFNGQSPQILGESLTWWTSMYLSRTCSRRALPIAIALLYVPAISVAGDCPEGFWGKGFLAGNVDELHKRVIAGGGGTGGIADNAGSFFQVSGGTSTKTASIKLSHESSLYEDLEPNTPITGCTRTWSITFSAPLDKTSTETQLATLAPMRRKCQP